MRQAENRVKIEGILSEIDLNYGSYVKNGSKIESIGGSIKVQVNQEINGKPTTLEIPVHLFSSKYTKAGKLNPSYESIEKVMNEFISIASCGSAEKADKVRITNADIRMNEFIGQNGQVVSMPRIHASFVSHAIGDFKPEATFTLEFMLANMQRVLDRDGVEVSPAQLKADVIVPQYTSPNATSPVIDIVPLYANNMNVINAIESYWSPNQCFKASGRLNFSSRTEEVREEVGFGEAMTKTRTISVSEFIITGGSQSPLEDELAFNIDEIKAGLAARKEKLEDMKSGKIGTKKTPAPSSSVGALDLGF